MLNFTLRTGISVQNFVRKTFGTIQLIIDGTGFNDNWDSTIWGISGPVLIKASNINLTGFRVINSNGVGIKAINGLPTLLYIRIG